MKCARILMKIRPSSNRTHQRLSVEGDRLSITTPLEDALSMSRLAAQRRTRVNGAPVEQQASIARSKSFGGHPRRWYSPTDHRQPSEVDNTNFDLPTAWLPPRHPLPSSLDFLFSIICCSNQKNKRTENRKTEREVSSRESVASARQLSARARSTPARLHARVVQVAGVRWSTSSRPTKRPRRPALLCCQTRRAARCWKHAAPFDILDLAGRSNRHTSPHRCCDYRLPPSKNPWRFLCPSGAPSSPLTALRRSPQQLVSEVRCRADIVPMLLVPLLVPTSPLLVTVLQVIAVPHVSNRCNLLAPPVHIQLLCLVRASLHFDTEPLRS